MGDGEKAGLANKSRKTKAVIEKILVRTGRQPRRVFEGKQINEHLRPMDKSIGWYIKPR